MQQHYQQDYQHRELDYQHRDLDYQRGLPGTMTMRSLESLKLRIQVQVGHLKIDAVWQQYAMFTWLRN